MGAYSVQCRVSSPASLLTVSLLLESEAIMSKWSSAFRDSRWQKKRLEIMQRDEFTCQSCSKKEGAVLNVHHVYYEKNKAPWEYDNDMLITWCEECHERRHELQKGILMELMHCDLHEVGSTHFLLVNIPHVMNIVSELYYNCILSSKIDNALIKLTEQIANGEFK